MNTFTNIAVVIAIVATIIFLLFINSESKKRISGINRIRRKVEELNNDTKTKGKKLSEAVH